MADPNALDFLRIPADVLVALDNRPLHFMVQPWHHLVRMAHILSMAAFFGGISLLDLRLMGVRPAVSLPGPLRSTSCLGSTPALALPSRAGWCCSSTTRCMSAATPTSR